MTPVVNDDLVTAADLIPYDCPKCGGKFRDLTKYQCEDCEKKFWNEITLDPDWFPGKLEDGTPDWNSVTTKHTYPTSGPMFKEWMDQYLKDNPNIEDELNEGKLDEDKIRLRGSTKDTKGTWSYEAFKIQGREIEEGDINLKRAVRLTKDEIKQKQVQDKKEKKELIQLIENPTTGGQE